MKFLLIPFLVLFLVSNGKPEKVHDKHIDRTFVVMDIEGWKYLVNEEILKNKNWPTVKRIMSNQLYGMKLFLKDEVIKDMQKVTTYVDIKQEGKAGAEYHPSKKWLIDNKFSPNKAKCVEYSNVEGFLRYTKSQPWVVLHELIHAYHDQVLGFDNKEIIGFYKSALQSKKYNIVKHISGKDRIHYGSTDHKEYLSEAAEAFFGVNDFYPFVRAELKEYDPDVFNFLKKLAK